MSRLNITKNRSFFPTPLKWLKMFERPPPERDMSFPSHFISISIKGLVEIPCIWAIIVRQFRSVILWIRLRDPCFGTEGTGRDGRHEVHTFQMLNANGSIPEFARILDMGAKQDILWFRTRWVPADTPTIHSAGFWIAAPVVLLCSNLHHLNKRHPCRLGTKKNRSYYWSILDIYIVIGIIIRWD